MTRFDRWAKKYTKWLKTARLDIRLIIFFSLVFMAMIFSTVFGFRNRHADEPVELGVSFSVKYAEELGNDWKRNFIALTDEVQVERMRLMSYWDTVEPEDGKYTFEDLDWQMDTAASRQVKVSLAIGQRQPRWPECHTPEWVQGMDYNQHKQQLFEFLTAVVNRYKNHPALESYQLENEAANNLFGHCPEFNAALLQQEFQLVKKLDPNHDVVINTSNQSGIPIKSGVGDRTGFSIYSHAYFPLFGKQWKWNYGYVPAWWHSLRAGLIEGLHQNSTFVHELQTEPWGPTSTVQLSAEEQAELMDGEEIVDSVDYALKTGMNEVYLWGGEWWWYRKENFNDKELWNTVKTLYKSYNQESVQ